MNAENGHLSHSLMRACVSVSSYCGKLTYYYNNNCLFIHYFRFPS